MKTSLLTLHGGATSGVQQPDLSEGKGARRGPPMLQASWLALLARASRDTTGRWADSGGWDVGTAGQSREQIQSDHTAEVPVGPKPGNRSGENPRTESRSDLKA